VVKQVSDYPNALFHNLSLTKKRYCMMHGCNALFSNSLIDIFTLLPSNSAFCSQFKQLIKSISLKWHSTRFLEPVQTKHFFQRNLQQEVVRMCTAKEHTIFPILMKDRCEISHMESCCPVVGQ
jgi:hypothetical protein